MFGVLRNSSILLTMYIIYIISASTRATFKLGWSCQDDLHDLSDWLKVLMTLKKGLDDKFTKMTWMTGDVALTGRLWGGPHCAPCSSFSASVDDVWFTFGDCFERRRWTHMTLPTRQRFHENTTGDPRFSFLEVGDQLEAFSNNDQRKQSE